MLHVRVNVPADTGCLMALGEGLVLLNMELMRFCDERGVQLPSLYDTDIVYRREPPGREWWETATDLMGVVKDKSGDCEDLAGYEAAWLRYFGVDEDARLLVIQTGKGKFHCQVERGDGTIEDPSLELLHKESERTGVPIESLSRLYTTDTRYSP